jgi:hypothetical protein
MIVLLISKHSFEQSFSTEPELYLMHLGDFATAIAVILYRNSRCIKVTVKKSTQCNFINNTYMYVNHQ